MDEKQFQQEKKEYYKWAPYSIGGTALQEDSFESMTREQQEKALQDWKERERQGLIDKLTIQYKGLSIIREEKEKLEKHSTRELRYMVKRETIKPQVLIQFQSKQDEKATELIVNFLKSKYKFKTLKDDVKPEIWVYQEGIYEEHGISTIKEETRKILGDAYTTYKANQVVEKIQADTYINQEKFFNMQNEHPYLLPVKNGLLNLKTRELKPFTPTIPFFNKINAEYDPDADCPEFKKFVSEIVENPEEDTKVIQEMFGFSMIKDYKYEKAFMLYGKQGRNGKSKLLEALTSLLGIQNTSDINLQDIETEKFEIANLQNKLINISADISNQALKGTGMFKNLTGRDTVEAQRKFKTSVKFKNYSKLIFAANELPPTNTQSNAFWLRWVILNFPYQFLPQKEIKALDADEKEKVKLQDQDIIKKITTQEELNGILNWAIEGLHRLDGQKDFSTTKVARETEKVWTRLSDSVRAFLMDHVEEHYEGQIEKQEFKRKYSKYCIKHHLKPRGDKQIKISLENEFGATSKRIQSQFFDSYFWMGVKWKNHQGHQGNQGISTLPSQQSSRDEMKTPSEASDPSDFNNSFIKNESDFRFPQDAQETKVVDYDVSLLKRQLKSLGQNVHFSKLASELGADQNDVFTTLKKLQKMGDVYENKPEHFSLLE